MCDTVSACLAPKDKAAGGTTSPSIANNDNTTTETCVTSTSLMDMLSEIDPLDLGFMRGLTVAGQSHFLPVYLTLLLYYCEM